MLLRGGRGKGQEKPSGAGGNTTLLATSLSLSLSRVLDLVVYRSTVQAEPDSRDKGRVEKQYLQLALVITSRELKMVTE